MDAARMQAKIFAGYGKATKRVGATFSIYRPATWITPIQPAHLIGTVKVAGTPARTNQFSFDKSLGPDDYVRNGLFDGSNCRVHDLLVGSSVTYFIGAIEPLMPPTIVRCPDVITHTRYCANPPLVGAAPYSGLVKGSETTLASSVPAAITRQSVSTRSRGPTPSSAPGPNAYQIWMPLPDGSVRDRDFLTDQLGYRYQVASAQSTLLGYRVEAIRLEA